jgi:hypothetical protein
MATYRNDRAWIAGLPARKTRRRFVQGDDGCERTTGMHSFQPRRPLRHTIGNFNPCSFAHATASG